MTHRLGDASSLRARDARFERALRPRPKRAREHDVRGRFSESVSGAPVPGPGRDGERVSESPLKKAAAPRVVRLSRRARRLAQTRLEGSPRDTDGKRAGRSVERRLRLGRLELSPVVHRAGVGVVAGGRRVFVFVFVFHLASVDVGKRRDVGALELEPRGWVRPLARVHAPAALDERHRGARGAESERGRSRGIRAWPARRGNLGVGVRAQRPDDATGPAERYRRVRVFTHGRARVRRTHRDSRRRSGIVASTRDPGWRWVRRCGALLSLALT